MKHKLIEMGGGNEDCKRCHKHFYEFELDTLPDWNKRHSEECIILSSENCDICQGFAGLETSPEGQTCEICKQWICNDCDYASKIKRKDDYLLCVCENCFNQHGSEFLNKTSEDYFELTNV